MVGAPFSHKTPSSAPAASATRGGGRDLVKRRGQNTKAASVAMPMPRASALKPANASGRARTAPVNPPGAGGAPRKGRTSIIMMMTPMPDMKPETTTYGV